MNCSDAIEHAKREATRLGSPMTVWRGGDKFVVSKENITYGEIKILFDGHQGPVRPVATYDPDGTESR